MDVYVQCVGYIDSDRQYAYIYFKKLHSKCKTISNNGSSDVLALEGYWQSVSDGLWEETVVVSVYLGVQCSVTTTREEIILMGNILTYWGYNRETDWSPSVLQLFIWQLTETGSVRGNVFTGALLVLKALISCVDQRRALSALCTLCRPGGGDAAVCCQHSRVQFH